MAWLWKSLIEAHPDDPKQTETKLSPSVETKESLLGKRKVAREQINQEQDKFLKNMTDSLQKVVDKQTNDPQIKERRERYDEMKRAYS